jgi:hypothetical protein
MRIGFLAIVCSPVDVTCLALGLHSDALRKARQILLLPSCSYGKELQKAQTTC